MCDEEFYFFVENVDFSTKKSHFLIVSYELWLICNHHNIISWAYIENLYCVDLELQAAEK